MSDEQTNSHHAVVGYDGSGNSVAALNWAFDYVQRLGGGSVKVVLSWNYAPAAMSGYGLGAFLPPADSMQTATESSLNEALEGISPPEGVTMTTVVREGPAVQVLIDESKDAELLVVGKRGHGGFLGLLIGSVATQVANHATCPVVIVPAPEG